jgi:hypothetical protein
MKNTATAKFDPPEGPALLRPHHVQTRHLSTVAGAPMGYENERESPLHHARKKERIDEQEYQAGMIYFSLYRQMGRSGKDSTDFVVVGGSSGLPFSQGQVDAIHAIQAIESHLHGEWAIIVRKFCGEGYEANEAIQAAGYKNPRQVWEKMRLALSKLATAIVKSHVKVSRETSSDD